MAVTVYCKTRFDISATGVKHYFKPTVIPFNDETGTYVENQELWNKSRNQQRNWETLTQLISLRTLPENISKPRKIIENTVTYWMFEFDINNLAAVSKENDLSLLIQDCKDVPMYVNLEESKPQLASMLITYGPDQNIWFTLNT